MLCKKIKYILPCPPLCDCFRISFILLALILFVLNILINLHSIHRVTWVKERERHSWHCNGLTRLIYELDSLQMEELALVKRSMFPRAAHTRRFHYADLLCQDDHKGLMTERPPLNIWSSIMPQQTLVHLSHYGSLAAFFLITIHLRVFQLQILRIACRTFGMLNMCSTPEPWPLLLNVPMAM